MELGGGSKPRLLANLVISKVEPWHEVNPVSLTHLPNGLPRKSPFYRSTTGHSESTAHGGRSGTYPLAKNTTDINVPSLNTGPNCTSSVPDSMICVH